MFDVQLVLTREKYQRSSGQQAIEKALRIYVIFIFTYFLIVSVCLCFQFLFQQFIFLCFSILLCFQRVNADIGHMNSHSNSSTMRRDYYRGSQDSLAIRGKIHARNSNRDNYRSSNRSHS